MEPAWRRIRRPLIEANQWQYWGQPRVLLQLQRGQLGFVCSKCARATKQALLTGTGFRKRRECHPVKLDVFLAR